MSFLPGNTLTKKGILFGVTNDKVNMLPMKVHFSGLPFKSFKNDMNFESGP